MHYDSSLKFEERELSESNPVKYFLRTFGSDIIIRLHYHNSLEINACRNVSGVVRFESGEIDLSEDGILVIPPGIPHSYRLLKSKGSIGVYHFLTGSLPGGNYAAETLDDALYMRLEDCSSGILDNLENCRFPGSGIMKYAGSLLFIAGEIESYRKRISYRRDREDSFLRQVIDYTEKRYSGRIPLREISSAAGMSQYHFSRKFSKKAGENWSRYLRAVRLSNSIRELKNGASVSEAGAAAGFESDSYYIKCFKEEYGITPKQWIKTS